MEAQGWLFYFRVKTPKQATVNLSRCLEEEERKHAAWVKTAWWLATGWLSSLLAGRAALENG